MYCFGGNSYATDWKEEGADGRTDECIDERMNGLTDRLNDLTTDDDMAGGEKMRIEKSNSVLSKSLSDCITRKE